MLGGEGRKTALAVVDDDDVVVLLLVLDIFGRGFVVPHASLENLKPVAAFHLRVFANRSGRAAFPAAR